LTTKTANYAAKTEAVDYPVETHIEQYLPCNRFKIPRDDLEDERILKIFAPRGYNNRMNIWR